MDKRTQSKFRKLLQIERQNVLYKISTLAEGSSSEASAKRAGDDADRALARITQEQLSRLGERERLHLAKIQAALTRLDDKEYGQCESCGDKIASARLEARPFSVYCISCKSAEELRARHYTKLIEDDEGGWLEAD